MSLRQEVFTDLDFADDVSVMAEMLEVLILAFELMNEESSALEINCMEQDPDTSLRYHR